MELEKSSFIEYIDPNTLKPHPINESIYGADGYKDLIESIRELGVQQALYVTKENIIVSGHRRWHAAIEAGVRVVPVIRVRYENELSERRAIIEHNRYRVKNGQQLYNEGVELEKIESVLAAIRVKESQKEFAKNATRNDKGQIIQSPQNFGESSKPVFNSSNMHSIEDMRRKRIEKHQNEVSSKVGDTIGISGEQWRKLKTIAKHKPELLPHINKGRSIASGYNEVKRELKKDDIKKIKPQELIGKYNVILADPPWLYDNNSTVIRSVADNEYPTMQIEDIVNMPVSEHTLDNAVLFLWATNPMLPKALRVIEAWGFSYKTAMVWVKNKIGTGFFVRSKHELVLIATKGSFTPMTTDIPASVIAADATEHSKKPEIIYDIIEKMYPEQKYCELFARSKHSEKWYVWGNEV